MKRQLRRERHAQRGINVPLQPRYPEEVTFTAAQQVFIDALVETRHQRFVEHGVDNKILKLYRTLLILTEAELMLSRKLLKLLTT